MAGGDFVVKLLRRNEVHILGCALLVAASTLRFDRFARLKPCELSDEALLVLNLLYVTAASCAPARRKFSTAVEPQIVTTSWKLSCWSTNGCSQRRM